MTGLGRVRRCNTRMIFITPRKMKAIAGRLKTPLVVLDLNWWARCQGICQRRRVARKTENVQAGKTPKHWRPHSYSRGKGETCWFALFERVYSPPPRLRVFIRTSSMFFFTKNILPAEHACSSTSCSCVPVSNILNYWILAIDWSIQTATHQQLWFILFYFQKIRWWRKWNEKS